MCWQKINKEADVGCGFIFFNFQKQKLLNSISQRACSYLCIISLFSKLFNVTDLTSLLFTTLPRALPLMCTGDYAFLIFLCTRDFKFDEKNPCYGDIELTKAILLLRTLSLTEKFCNGIKFFVLRSLTLTENKVTW